MPHSPPSKLCRPRPSPESSPRFAIMASVYPTQSEAKLIAQVEKLMQAAMSKYDPSHDAYHGESIASILRPSFSRFLRSSTRHSCQGKYSAHIRLRLLLPSPSLVQRVRKNAMAIARSVMEAGQKPDLLVVELAALMHDMADKKYVSAELAADPLAFFSPMLQLPDREIDLVADGRAELVAKVVVNVSWTTETKLIATGKITEWHKTCVELHCVQDADRLDAIGAFGEQLLLRN